MKYLGGKARMAVKIARFVKSAAGDRELYVEPFVGGGYSFAANAPLFRTSIAADAMPDVALLWQAVAAGWVPPSTLTEDEYRALRHAEPSALRAFAGFGCSFGGKWFAGYSRPRPGTRYWDQGAGEAARGIERKRAAFAGASAILHADYADLTPLIGPGAVVYADPPYAGTTSYAGAPAWDAERWWNTARAWRETGALVLVSEYSAPPDWRPVAWEQRTASMRDADGDQPVELELVFA